MSHFSKHFTIKKTVLVTFFGKQYTTPTGLTQMLADRAAQSILAKHRSNEKKYGAPTYSNQTKLSRWTEHRTRLRKKFYRRALPIITKLFENTAK